MEGILNISLLDQLAPDLKKEVEQAVSTAEKLMEASPEIFEIADDGQYQRALAMYRVLENALPEEDGETPQPSDEYSAIQWVVSMLADALEKYDEPLWEPAPVDDEPPGVTVLRMLMDQHMLTQSDLPEVGSQGIVSEILSCKRELNLRQIKTLSESYGVPQRFFLGE